MNGQETTRPRNWSDLAREAGVDRAQVSTARRRDDWPFGQDTPPSAADYLRWKNQLTPLEEAKLREQIRKLRHENDCNEAQYVLRAEFEASYAACAAEIRREFSRMPGKVLKAMKKLPAGARKQLRQYLEEWVDEVCTTYEERPHDGGPETRMEDENDE